MPDEVISREAIAKQAEAAAMRSIASGRCEPNPHAPDTDAAKAWEIAFARYLRIHSSVEDMEGGA